MKWLLLLAAVLLLFGFLVDRRARKRGLRPSKVGYERFETSGPRYTKDDMTGTPTTRTEDPTLGDVREDPDLPANPPTEPTTEAT